MSEGKKPLVYYIHEAFKHLGTNNWTVRQQDEKPPKPTAYPNDWIPLIEKDAYDLAIEALKNVRIQSDPVISQLIAHDVLEELGELV